jgi:hypothetical protein
MSTAGVSRYSGRPLGWWPVRNVLDEPRNGNGSGHGDGPTKGLDALDLV